MGGGAKLLCQLWETDVADCRRNIRGVNAHFLWLSSASLIPIFFQAFEHLLKTDLVFCAEHDVEFHIWKICFYQIVEVLKNYAKDEERAEIRYEIHCVSPQKRGEKRERGKERERGKRDRGDIDRGRRDREGESGRGDTLKGEKKREGEIERGEIEKGEIKRGEIERGR
jgi:hypothetical protein